MLKNLKRSLHLEYNRKQILLILMKILIIWYAWHSALPNTTLPVQKHSNKQNYTIHCFQPYAKCGHGLKHC